MLGPSAHLDGFTRDRLPPRDQWPDLLLDGFDYPERLNVAVELTDQNRRQLWIPRGFAHGFAVKSDTADFFYKCDAPYNPSNEIIVRWNDPALGIEWGVVNPILSKRDAAAPMLADVSDLPVYEP